MVDKYISCIYEDCNGVMERQGSDNRAKKVNFICNKCGRPYALERKQFEHGRMTFQLNDPNDPLRGQMK
ncbi:MAG: hypothetical protein FK734_09240 [Asgard group archaeon]|nr:hypothetical protein [Asgard group archaeon]